MRIRVATLHLPARTATGRRFLLLHGNPSHMEHFAANIEWLRERGEVALLDLPGFGESPTPHQALSLDFFAEVAAAYACSLGWLSGVDVIGQSHGGAVGQTLAARHPELVRSLILLGTMGYPAHLSMHLARLPAAAFVMEAIARRAGRPPYSTIARVFATRLTKISFAPDPVPDGFIEAEVARALRSPQTQASAIRANDGRPSEQLREQASRIVAPILLVHGKGDRLVPIAYARRLWEHIGHRHAASQMMEIEGGHMVHLSRPEHVHALLDPFFERTARS